MNNIGLFVELKASGKTAEEKRNSLRQKICDVLIKMKNEGFVFGAGAKCDGIVVCSSMLANPFITLIFAKENETILKKMIAVFASFKLPVQKISSRKMPVRKNK